MYKIRKTIMVLLIAISVISSISFADNDDLPFPICKCHVEPTVVVKMVK